MAVAGREQKRKYMQVGKRMHLRDPCEGEARVQEQWCWYRHKLYPYRETAETCNSVATHYDMVDIG